MIKYGFYYFAIADADEYTTRADAFIIAAS